MKRPPPLLPGEDDNVVRAAIYDLPRMEIDTPDKAEAAAVLADVKGRYDTYELEQGQAAHKRWRASLPPPTLYQRRLALGLKQSELAERLGVHVITVSKWERGVVPVPRWLHLALWAVEHNAPHEQGTN